MLFDFDLSGGEWHCTAYLSRDQNMLAVSKSGKSPHILTACSMFGVSEEIAHRDYKLTDELTSPEEILAIRKEKIPELANVRFLPRTASMRNAAKRCLIKGTLVLTRNGWVPIESIKAGDQIFQWDIANRVKEDIVQATYEYPGPHHLLNFKGLFVDQTVTENHRIPIRHTKNGRVWAVEAANFDNSTTALSWPLSGNLIDTISPLLNTLEIQLLVAMQADCTIENYGNVRFRLCKERKQCRLRHILQELDIPFMEREDKQTFYIPKNPIINKLVFFLSGFSYKRQTRGLVRKPRSTKAHKKLFGPYLLQLGEAGRQIFLDELPLWDGNVGKKVRTYFTTIENNAMWVQTIAHLNSLRATVRKTENGIRKDGSPRSPLYWVNLGTTDNSTACSIKISTVETEESVYCLTVPSGYFLVRYRGKISVTGNSNFGLNYREGYKTFALKNEMEEREAKQIVRLYRDVAYPGLKTWYTAIDESVRRTRTVTNCFGRRIYLMGEMNDDTFRQATAAVPQSTIVDITDRAMPMIMENESVEFRACELRDQVHDAIFVDYLSVDFSAMAACAYRIANDYMSPELEYHGEKFTLGVTAKAGLDWGHLHEIDGHALATGGVLLADELKRINEKARAQCHI